MTICLRDYLDYADRQQDDCPLYVFDESILDDIPELAASCAPPPALPRDVWRGLPSRPPHRWVLIGAERSGSAPHVDPDASAAWNTLVSGQKRWFFFPPSVSEEDVYVGAPDGDSARESVAHWMHGCYPRLHERLPCIETMQWPGTTVYVPHGWWHAVVNVQLSVAVTANFVHSGNAADALAAVRRRDPAFAEEVERGAGSNR